MAVRFIVGRAGSGKTYRVLEAVRARLRESASDGSSLIVLVPEQATFQIERALIETPDLPAYTRCDVLGFQRLAHRIFVETGADPRRADLTIGHLGRLMAIRRLIRFERSQLKMLIHVADKPGLVRRISDTLDELMRRQVPPEDLLTLADQCAEDRPLSSARLHDMGRIYAAYLDYLQSDRIDPAQYLTLAAERVKACSWLSGAEVWVDGFAGFTEQELGLLVELARSASSLEITLLLDPRASALEATTLPRESHSLFARTERTLVKLRELLQAAGIVIEEHVRLESDRAHRFRATALQRLERHLFRSRPPPSTASDASPHPEIRVIEATDRRTEVRAAVDEIRRLMRESDPPLRYRDVAIIVRDLEAYHELLSSAMRTEGIPFFLDRRQSTGSHPFIILLRGLLRFHADDLRLNDVRAVLKTGLLPFSEHDADLLENYVLAHNIQGYGAWSHSWAYTRVFRTGRDGKLTPPQEEQLRRINAIRERWNALLEPWLRWVDSPESEPAGMAWGEALVRCLDRLGVARRLYDWADTAEQDGRVDEADAHRQVWHDWLELIDEFVRALGEDPMTIQIFRESLEAGLGEFDLGLAPPTLDQVLIGSIERSRHPEIRAALVLGFDERHFPMRRGDEPMLGEEERELLAAAGRDLGPTRRQQILDERMLAYIAFTRSSSRLWISYPQSDAEGSAIQPSPFLSDLRTALPGLEVESQTDPWQTREVLWITRVSELGGRLAWEMRSRCADPREEVSPEIRARWNILFARAIQRDDWRTTLRRSMAGLAYRNDAALPPGAVDRVLTGPYVTSISRLEQFAACPFSHFAQYALKLEPRVEPQVAEVELGTICHAVLEKFIADLAEQNRSLADLEDDAIAEGIEAAAAATIPRLTAEMLALDPRSAYLFDQSRSHLHRSARWQRNAARAGKFAPCKAEWEFGFDPTGDRAVPLRTPSGRTIYLRGLIDRVDVADLGETMLGMVIDYKRTKQRTLSYTQVYHGLALQLVGYLIALMRAERSPAGRPIQPVAAFFLPLLMRNVSLKHPGEARSEDFKYRGLIRLDALEAADANATSGQASAYMSARVRNDGQPYANSDLLTAEQFGALIDHVQWRMGELADQVLDGIISVSPYRLNRHMPCTFCSFQSVCRFDVHHEPARILQSLKKEELFQKLERGDSA